MFARDTVKINKTKARMVAHRGVSGLETENTNAAFIAAGQRSYFGVETDTQRTKDGSFITFHDGELDRMMGVSVKISDITLEELRTYTMRDMNDGLKRSDLVVPTLDEYVRICKHYNKVCVLELKGAFSVKDVEDMLEIINKEEYLDGIIFISGEWSSLISLRKVLKTHPAQYITGKITDELIASLVENHLDADPYFEALTEENIKKMHENGITVNCWTVNDPETAEKLDRWGVDMITSNFIE
jgi:glycerophosphoryl diester phosphodiesterase